MHSANECRVRAVIIVIGMEHEHENLTESVELKVLFPRHGCHFSTFQSMFVHSYVNASLTIIFYFRT